MVGETAELLPEKAVLLHIGPYKTGSTALQAALFAAKPRLGEFGVAYPGVWRRIVGAGYAALGAAPRGRTLPAISVWEHFAEQVRKRDQLRVCVSTEDFSNTAKADRFSKIIDDLGGERVHVVTVARGFHRLLPSSWQESIKAHGIASYDEWLHEVLDEDASGFERDTFWDCHDIERTAEAWLPIVGQAHFQVIIANDSDPRYLLGIFERLLGLPDGLLTLTETRNPSLTAGGAEVLRRLNRRFADEGWSDELYFGLIQSGLNYGLQASETAHDQKLPNLPAWALERVRELTEHRIGVLKSLGVPVIGDVDRLRVPDDYIAGDAEDAVSVISVDSVVSGLGQLLSAAVRREERLRQAAAAKAKPPRPVAKKKKVKKLRDHESRELVAELSRRGRQRVRRLVGKSG